MIQNTKASLVKDSTNAYLRAVEVGKKFREVCLNASMSMEQLSIALKKLSIPIKKHKSVYHS